MTIAAAPSEIVEDYHAYGATVVLFRTGPQQREVILSGPAGTGKSRGVLEYLNWCCTEWSNIRCLMLRKTRRSLTESGMVTFERKVLHPAQGVYFHSTTQQYRYPNGSILAVGGMDKPGKIMSSEWDVIYVQEATELRENEWESATTRLRNGKLPWQQMLGDCNPDAPSHWLRQRALQGRALMLESRHEDNPTVTAEYLATLNALTGVRRARLYLGEWAAAEGMVYEMWDRDKHIVPRFKGNYRGDPPHEWPRYLAVDFGFTHPFVCQWWAIDPDGRLWMYREIYRTQRIVQDHAAEIKRLSRWGQEHGDPLPRAIICDHDADGRATLERHLGMMTLAATKSVKEGIQVVAARLRPAGDGKPRLFYLQDSLEDPDPFLRELRQPASTVEEYESYVWSKAADGSYKEEPQKDLDHGMDATRYMVANRDLSGGWAKSGPRLF